jgi:uncharacterized protein (DUF2336 family)
MTSNIEGSPQPAQASLSFLAEIERAIERSSPHRRAAMLIQITDLFIHQSSRLAGDKIELFGAVIARLASEIELSARVMLACRLAPIPAAPINILRNLASDDNITVASPVLTHAEGLDETTLLLSARTKSHDHLFAISQRKLVSELVSDLLVARGNKQVLLSLVENPGALLSEAALARLVERSQDCDALATSLGARPDIPYFLFQKLLAITSDTVRARFIADNLHIRREYGSAEPYFQFAGNGRPLIAVSRAAPNLRVA